MNITSATNPRTKNAKAYIDLDITLEDCSVRPFTATPADPLGAELYKKAKRGEFGKVSVALDEGYQWDGAQWVAPSNDTLVSAAEAKKASLIAIVEAAIAPLERAVKLDMATDEERTQLDAWERYSVLLSRVDTSKASDIEWPTFAST